MCGVNEAMAVFKVAGAVAGHQEKKRVARENAYANMRARMTADAAYLVDLGKIETERGMAAREKEIAIMTENMKRKGDQATGLNMGFGNATRVVQNIGTVMDMDFNQINADFMGDMITLNNQRDDAYANLKRTYNSLTPVYEPSMFSLGLDIAGAGASYMATPRDERRFFKDYGAKSRSTT